MHSLRGKSRLLPQRALAGREAEERGEEKRIRGREGGLVGGREGEQEFHPLHGEENCT